MTRSLSNLYKQYWVTNQQDNARVINANAVLEERKAKLLERQLAEQRYQEELAKSFAAGIVREDTEIIEEVPEIEEVDYVEQAKEEAERILSEANTQAQSVLNQAYEDAQRLREEAKVQGFAEAEAVMKKELQQKSAALDAEYSAKSRVLEQDYTSKRDSMEKDLVDVILEVFNKVFHIQFDNKKHILMHLINNTILNIEGDRSFRIKVAESNVLFLENHREDILERVGHGIELEFIADSSLDGNDCFIETDSGVFDCGLDTQLENLIKDIKSLSL